MKFEYPLLWLPQQQRTKNPKRARFGNYSPFFAGEELIEELNRLGAKNCIISSNLQQRARGDGFYSNQRTNDPGIVIYFDLKGKNKAMACDCWDKPEHNLWALYLSIKAIRGLERWGGSKFLDGLFTGFTALPGPDDVIMQEQQYFKEITNKEDFKQKYRSLVKQLHPDNNNGNCKNFNIMKKQYDQIKHNFE